MVEQNYGMAINSPEFNDFMNFLTSQVQKQYELDRTDLSQNLAARGIQQSPYGTQPLQKLAETTAQQKQGIVTNMGWQEYMANRNRQQQLQDVNRERQWNLEDYEKQKQLALQMAEQMKPKEPQWWEKLLPLAGTVLGSIAAPALFPSLFAATAAPTLANTALSAGVSSAVTAGLTPKQPQAPITAIGNTWQNYTQTPNNKIIYPYTMGGK